MPTTERMIVGRMFFGGEARHFRGGGPAGYLTMTSDLLEAKLRQEGAQGPVTFSCTPQERGLYLMEAEATRTATKPWEQEPSRLWRSPPSTRPLPL